MTWDYLIVGAGFAGSVLAERLASQRGARCLVVDRRDHIGGNAFDKLDAAGVLIHPYGPHYFRTNSDRVIAWTIACCRGRTESTGSFRSI
jgi:UDP-galactopyranose mutase